MSITTEALALVTLSVEWRHTLLAMMDDYLRGGDARYENIRERVEGDFAGLLAEWQAIAAGCKAPPGYCQELRYWLVRDNREILGGIRLRPEMPESLQRSLGNIGYDVRPSARNSGYATVMLAQALVKARELGLARVMLICEPANIASARVMQKNGGVLESEYISAQSGKRYQRYWIEL